MDNPATLATFDTLEEDKQSKKHNTERWATRTPPKNRGKQFLSLIRHSPLKTYIFAANDIYLWSTLTNFISYCCNVVSSEPHHRKESNTTVVIGIYRVSEGWLSNTEWAIFQLQCISWREQVTFDDI